MEEWGKTKWLANKRTEQACSWGFKPFICEIRLPEHKSILIDKGLNYFISVKLLILETIVSQRPWLHTAEYATEILASDWLYFSYDYLILLLIMIAEDVNHSLHGQLRGTTQRVQRRNAELVRRGEV